MIVSSPERITLERDIAKEELNLLNEQLSIRGTQYNIL
jgi:hypothetical protein